MYFDKPGDSSSSKKYLQLLNGPSFKSFISGWFYETNIGQNRSRILHLPDGVRIL